MKLRARHRGIDDLHDDYFNRVKGRTLSNVTHHSDETTELHFHELTFSKPGEPDATLAVVPVTSLVRPHFSLSRQRVQQLQMLLVEKSSELLKVLDTFELAQLHYCIGSVWSVAWLPLEEGETLSPRTASGSPSDEAALSGRAERAVPPEASPEGRKTPLEQIARVAVSEMPRAAESAPATGWAAVHAVIERVLHDDNATNGETRIAEELAPLLQAMQPPALHPLHSIDCEIDNRTEFAIKAEAQFLGRLPEQGARYEIERCVLTILDVSPQPGNVWPE